MSISKVVILMVYFIFVGLLATTSTTAIKMSATTCADRSVHSAYIEEVHEVPMNVIHRPIPSVLDEEKVQSLMETIKVCL